MPKKKFTPNTKKKEKTLEQGKLEHWVENPNYDAQPQCTWSKIHVGYSHQGN